LEVSRNDQSNAKDESSYVTAKTLGITGGTHLA
jgi:hypothetical protein